MKFLIEQLQNPGEYPFVFQTGTGQIEAILTTPERVRGNYLAILGHPHSLQGGTMQNKVVTTLARAFKEQGIAAIRFNFRGVGQSSGIFDQGIGESQDMLQLMDSCKSVLPNSQFLLAGFSFGAYVTYRAAAAIMAPLLISVAPPVTRFDFKEFPYPGENWQILQGICDEVVPEEAVKDFAETFSPPIACHLFDTGHFFHGQLLTLKAKLAAILEDFFRQNGC